MTGVKREHFAIYWHHMQNRKFPGDFIWGAATSSHQVEGGNDNDWTEFENSGGKIYNEDRSGLAADHWNRYEEDFDILEELNLNTYRFSIEWSRVEPQEGQFNQEAIDHYRAMLTSLKRRGITPAVTLHHFTNPKWLPLWTDKNNIGYFVRYTKFVVEQLGDLCEHWCTINEPNNFATLGYALDMWAPGIQQKSTLRPVLRNLAAAHNNAYEIIHRTYKAKGWQRPMVSITLQLNYFTPMSQNPLDWAVMKAVSYFRNYYLLNRVKKKLDYLGFNYYFGFHVKWNDPGSYTDIRYPGLDLPTNDLGWNIEPEGLYHSLLEFSKLGIPILITENGIPDAKDTKREWYIISHLEQVHRAMQDGAQVIGYIHWSLLDNFEWADGYKGRFGLVEVDFETQQRTIRGSARTYAQIAKTGELPPTPKVPA